MAKTRPVRGATLNAESGRFGLPEREADGDWLDERESLDGAALSLRTTVTVERPRTIISRNASPDMSFDRSINPYRGCEHGCIYCFARPTHSYLGLSPGLDFESRLFAKVNAADLLRRELAKPGYVPENIAIGVNTDAYQPCERERRITREVLEVLRLRSLEGEPVLLERTVYAGWVAPAVEKLPADCESVTEALYESIGLVFAYGEHLIDAVPAGARDARLLGVRRGSPLLRQRRVTTTHEGRPVESSDDRYRAGSVAFSIRNSIGANPLGRQAGDLRLGPREHMFES